jgi:hypothetical protein
MLTQHLVLVNITFYSFNSSTPQKSTLSFNSYPNQNLITLSSDGLVGINNPTPQFPLDVNGNVRFGGDLQMAPSKNIVFNINQVDQPRLWIAHTGVHAYIDYMDNLNFRANKNWISALTLYGDGSVGVGFTTTYNQGDYRTHGYKFAVNGGIICEEVKVITDVPDADYVFEKDYKLLSLSEIESFVNKNKHLPNIPSAEQFKKDGYKVGEMDEMLLRKVEEFSLYLIEQNKRIEALEKENKELKAINNPKIGKK